ncbi:putative family 17 glucosidase [Starmerella bacillaris]|uniref:Family 17 glucosidase n=1 Tax=Starmerella bacillaris TaxID=1247836 RepID=A0AAV5RDR8_STABA|nr:putative family 17 glucosidase [Starmerella bacillaris]
MIPSFASIAISLLSGQALASEHHAHKRDAAVDYVTVMQTAYVTGGSNDVQATVAASVEAVTSAKVTSPEAVDATSTTISTAAAAATSAAETSSSSSSSGSSESAGSSGALGITYSPYTAEGGCKSASQVAADFANLGGYSIIRLYGVDCNQVANVYAAKSSGQKLFLGIYDVSNIASGIQEMHSGLNGDWSDVVTVSIGNELVNSGSASVEQIGEYVSTGRSALQSLGYTGSVVSVDTFIAVIENPGLCKYSDYMAVNAHAFFDGNVAAAQAGEWAVQQVQRVWEACSGSKSVTIVESGWPSQGDTYGKAVASQDDQTAAIDSLKSSIGNDVYLFNAYNDLWKAAGYLNCEKYWGIYGSSSS